MISLWFEIFEVQSVTFSFGIFKNKRAAGEQLSPWNLNFDINFNWEAVFGSNSICMRLFYLKFRLFHLTESQVTSNSGQTTLKNKKIFT